MLRYISILFSLTSCSSAIENNRIDETCLLQPETGYCRAAIPRYYFDLESGACKKFIWGGCGGVVPFETKSECKLMCKSTNNTELLGKLDESLKVWGLEKNRYGSSYQYSVRFSSWVGFGNSTTIHVLKDTVVKRVYRSWNQDMNTISQWEENNPASLGSHKEGASLYTVEKLYEMCQLLLQKNDHQNNDIYLDFDESGIIKNCLVSPRNCADDCSSGVNIQELEFQNQ